MEILNEYGFLVDTAEDGAEAVEKVKNSTAAGYDLVLMDVQMPVMNGYEATKQIRALDHQYNKSRCLEHHGSEDP